MHGNGEADRQSTQQKQIAAAQPVTAQTNAFRSEQLIGTDVRPQLSSSLPPSSGGPD